MRTGARTERAAALLVAFLVGCGIGVGPVRAQSADRVAVKGLQDLELFDTDSGSRLLSKNDGDLAGAGRLRLWVASDFGAGFQALLLGAVEGGKASEDENTRTSLEQAFVRYVSPGKTSVMVDVGRIVVPIGNFSKRYYSNVNPLIGEPDAYDVVYPEGVVATGRVSFFDYRVAVIDRPLANKKYVPQGDIAFRPALDLGFTPVTGLRIGGYYTRGTYLGHAVSPMLPAGTRWRDFDQRVAGLELEFSRGYFELNADLAFASYEVPTRSDIARGKAWFVEPKYTWTPRFYTALRLEANDYPFILPINSSFWVDQNAVFYDVEVGAGWRFTPDLLLKASYRQDRWNVSDSMQSFFPNGHAFALQLSYAFDVRSWLRPPR